MEYYNVTDLVDEDSDKERDSDSERQWRGHWCKSDEDIEADSDENSNYDDEGGNMVWVYV